MANKAYLCTRLGNSPRFLGQHLQTVRSLSDQQVDPQSLHQRNTCLLLWLAAVDPKAQNT